MDILKKKKKEEKKIKCRLGRLDLVWCIIGDDPRRGFYVTTPR